MSLMRKAARLVSSSCFPKRFMGTLLTVCSSISFEGIRRDQAPSVGNGPGAIALRRMLYLPHSTASEVVIASTPALAHAEGTTKPEPQFADAYVVTMFNTFPPSFREIQRLPKTCVQ